MGVGRPEASRQAWLRESGESSQRWRGDQETQQGLPVGSVPGSRTRATTVGALRMAGLIDWAQLSLLDLCPPAVIGRASSIDSMVYEVWAWRTTARVWVFVMGDEADED